MAEPLPEPRHPGIAVDLNLTDAYVVLKATGALDRRIRIPVKASTFDGGPRF